MTSFNQITLAVDMAAKKLADERGILHMHHKVFPLLQKYPP